MADLQAAIANLQKRSTAPRRLVAPTTRTATPRSAITPVTARVRPPGQPENKGLLGQLGDAIGTGFKGLIHLPAEAYKTFDYVQDLPERIAGQAVAQNRGEQVDWNPLDDQAGRSALWQDITQNSGLVGGMIGSLDNTRKRWFTGGVPGAPNPLGAIQAYKKASDEGQIVNVLLEDAGNASMGLSAGAAGLGRVGEVIAARGARAGLAGDTARAAKLAARGEAFVGAGAKLDNVAKLMGRGADAPVALPTKAIRKLNDLAGNPIKTRALPRLVESAPSVFQRYTDEGRQVMRASERERVARDTIRAQTIRDFQTAATKHSNLAGEALTDTESGAVVALRTGLADELRATMRAQPTMSMEQILDDWYSPADRVPGHYLTPEAAQLALDALDGKLPAAAERRMVQFKTMLDQKYALIEERSLAGYGRLSPLEADPLVDVHPRVVDKLTGDERVEFDLAREEAARQAESLRAMRTEDTPRFKTERRLVDPVTPETLAARSMMPGPDGPAGLRPSFEELRDPSAGYFDATIRPLQRRAQSLLAAREGQLTQLQDTVSDTRTKLMGAEPKRGQVAAPGLAELGGDFDAARERFLEETDQLGSQIYELEQKGTATASKKAARLSKLYDQRVAILQEIDDLGPERARELRTQFLTEFVASNLEARTAFDEMLRAEERTPIAMREDLVQPNYARQVDISDKPQLNPFGLDPRTEVGFRKSGSEMQRGGQTGTPFTVEGQTRAVSDELYRQEANQGYRRLLAEGEDVAAKLGPNVLGQIKAEAAIIAKQTGAKIDTVLSDGIARAMDDARYEPWPDVDPQRGADLKRTFIGQVDETTKFFPKGLRKTVAEHFTPGDPPGILNTLAKTNGWMKRLALPLSVNWHIGDAISNAMFAMVEGGVHPLDYAKGMQQTVDLMKTDGGRALLDRIAAATDAGSLAWGDHRDWLAGLDAETKRAAKVAKMKRGRKALDTLATPVRKAQDAGFDLNRKINDYGRNAFKIAELDRRLRNVGLDVDQVASGADLGNIPQAALDAIDEVVRDANRVFGTNPLTPAERRFVTPFVPFYHWMKVINGFAYRLARDNPTRILWASHLGNVAYDDKELPGFLEGAFETPFGYMSLSSLNPFADIMNNDGTPTALDPASLTRSLAPWAKVASAGLLGLDANKGFSPLTHSDELSSGPDSTGRLGLEPLIKHPGALLGYTARQLGPTRNLMDILPNVSLPTGLDLGSGARYGSSEVIETADGRLGGDRQLVDYIRQVPGLVGVRFPTPDYTQADVDQMNATAARRRLRSLREIGR